VACNPFKLYRGYKAMDTLDDLIKRYFLTEDDILVTTRENLERFILAIGDLNHD
jgi:hypothetical protein